jgi:hypothetical protein
MTDMIEMIDIIEMTDMTAEIVRNADQGSLDSPECIDGKLINTLKSTLL